MEQIAIDKIDVSEFNIRKTTGLTDVTELADSMNKLGLIQPIIVRKRNGRFEAVVGQRRLRAAQQLGWKKIDSIVRDLDDKTALAISLKENKDRADVDAFEYAHGVERFRAFFKTDTEAWEGLGMSKSRYYRWLSLLDLEPILKKVDKKRVAEGKVSPTGDTTEGGLRDYTPFKTIYEDTPEKLEELIEETIDLRPPERKRVLNGVKEFPERSIKRIKKEILAKPESVTLSIQFSASIGRGLEKAADDRHVSREDIVEVAIEDWLIEKDYMAG